MALHPSNSSNLEQLALRRLRQPSWLLVHTIIYSNCLTPYLPRCCEAQWDSGSNVHVQADVRVNDVIINHKRHTHYNMHTINDLFTRIHTIS